jgi:hypothetical protein
MRRHVQAQAMRPSCECISVWHQCECTSILADHSCPCLYPSVVQLILTMMGMSSTQPRCLY